MVNTSIFMQVRLQMAKQTRSINTPQLCWKVLKRYKDCVISKIFKLTINSFHIS